MFGNMAVGFGAGLGLGLAGLAVVFLKTYPLRTRKPLPVTSSFSGSVVFLYSDCLPENKNFWGTDIGLPVVADKGAVVFYRLPGTCGSLALVQEGVSAAAAPPVCARHAGKDTVMVCLLTSDVDGSTELLASRGHPIHQPPALNERFGIKNALLRSPEGYLVEIQQLMNPSEHSLFTA